MWVLLLTVIFVNGGVTVSQVGVSESRDVCESAKQRFLYKLRTDKSIVFPENYKEHSAACRRAV